MRQIIQTLSTHPRYAQVIEWGKLISITGGAQILIQGIGFISGILVIRLLPTQEYAFYTLANTMLGTMTILADGGISTGVMSQGGKVWKDREKLGAVLVTGMDLRKKFALGSIIISTPILFYLLRSHDASWLMSFLLIGSLIPAFFTTLSGGLLQIAPKLRQDILPLQKNQIGSNLGRLVLLGLTLFIFPWAFVALVAAGLPQIWANINLRKISLTYADWHQKIDLSVQKNILTIVKKILPGAIYYCISGQITIWLISVYGSTTAIAQIGALGRLAMVLSLFSMLFHILFVPRFTRLPPKRYLLLKRYGLVYLILVVISISIIGVAQSFSSQFLWILGKQYSGLTHELFLQIIGSCLNMIVGVSFVLNSSRGWIMNPILGIMIGLTGVLTGILLFDVSTLTGVLYFNIFTGVIGVTAYITYGLVSITIEKN